MGAGRLLCRWREYRLLVKMTVAHRALHRRADALDVQVAECRVLVLSKWINWLNCWAPQRNSPIFASVLVTAQTLSVMRSSPS
jgi:hypothetical protein